MRGDINARAARESDTSCWTRAKIGCNRGRRFHRGQLALRPLARVAPASGNRLRLRGSHRRNVLESVARMALGEVWRRLLRRGVWI